MAWRQIWPNADTPASALTTLAIAFGHVAMPEASFGALLPRETGRQNLTIWATKESDSGLFSN
jgi:hypothetical protein